MYSCHSASLSFSVSVSICSASSIDSLKRFSVPEIILLFALYGGDGNGSSLMAYNQCDPSKNGDLFHK